MDTNIKGSYMRGFAVNPKDDRVIIAGSSNVFVAGGRPDSKRCNAVC